MKLLKDLKIEKEAEQITSGDKWVKSWERVNSIFIFTAPSSFGRPLRPDGVSQWWNRFLK